MKYLLDTNICIYLIKKKPEKVLHHLLSLPISSVAISVITLAELEYGVQKSAFPQKNQLALMQFIAPLAIIPFDSAAATVYGNVRAQLEKEGKPIGSLDMLIAAQAISQKVILVTNNTAEFSRIPALKIENWV